jgi:hypothetical protein
MAGVSCAQCQRVRSLRRLSLKPGTVNRTFRRANNRQLGDVGGDAPGLVAGEEVRRPRAGEAIERRGSLRAPGKLREHGDNLRDIRQRIHWAGSCPIEFGDDSVKAIPQLEKLPICALLVSDDPINASPNLFLEHAAGVKFPLAHAVVARCV